MSTHRWTAVLPVKGGATAKSRLRPGAGLALALALDAVEAVASADAVAEVVVVTSDPAASEAASSLGARVVPESAPGSGLDAAVRDGAGASGGPVAVVLADLPALRPEDVDAALEACRAALATGARAAVVPDADGTGTVLLAARDAASLRPAFGAGSARRHEALGAVRLDLDLPRLRRDVDLPRDLDAARELGLGPRTAAALGAQARW